MLSLQTPCQKKCLLGSITRKNKLTVNLLLFFLDKSATHICVIAHLGNLEKNNCPLWDSVSSSKIWRLIQSISKSSLPDKHPL